jgi:hypothetical protein
MGGPKETSVPEPPVTATKKPAKKRKPVTVEVPWWSAEPLKPPLSLLVKLGSIAVHTDELLTAKDAHVFDRVAITSLLEDKEIVAWLKEMGKMALLPVKRW